VLSITKTQQLADNSCTLCLIYYSYYDVTNFEKRSKFCSRNYKWNSSGHEVEFVGIPLAKHFHLIKQIRHQRKIPYIFYCYTVTSDIYICRGHSPTNALLLI